jgi:hypothetical protein
VPSKSVQTRRRELERGVESLSTRLFLLGRDRGNGGRPAFFPAEKPVGKREQGRDQVRRQRKGNRQRPPENQAHQKKRPAPQQKETSDGKISGHRSTIISRREMTTTQMGLFRPRLLLPSFIPERWPVLLILTHIDGTRFLVPVRAELYGLRFSQGSTSIFSLIDAICASPTREAICALISLLRS